MGPMNDSPFGIPFVHSSKLHLVALSQVRYSRRDIDVVGNEQRLPGIQLQDETLMPASFAVVREYFLDSTPAFDLKIPGVLFESATKDLVAFG